MAAQWWVVSYYEVYGRTASTEQFTTVQAASQAAAIAAAQASLGGHATGVGELVKGPYASQAQAKAAEGTTASQAASGQLNPSGGPAGQPTNFPSPLSGLDAIGAFFNKLGSGTLWLRAGKIIGGGILLIAGLLKMTSLDRKALGVAGAAASKLPGV